MLGTKSSTPLKARGLNYSNSVGGIMDSAQSREKLISVASEKLAVEALFERHGITQLEDTIS